MDKVQHTNPITLKQLQGNQAIAASLHYIIMVYINGEHQLGAFVFTQHNHSWWWGHLNYNIITCSPLVNDNMSYA